VLLSNLKLLSQPKVVLELYFYFDAAVACGYFVTIMKMLAIDILGSFEKRHIQQIIILRTSLRGFLTERLFNFDADN
jgi:hypothetical protein